MGIRSTRSFRIAASTIVIAVSLTALTSCASETPGAGSPIASAGSSASASATPTPDTPCPDGTTPGPWGDVVALEQVDDSFGSYCHVALAPDAAAAQFDASVADTDSLATYGFTVEDAEAAQQVEAYGLRDAGVIVTQSLPSPLGRTGDPRASSTEISVDKIFAGVNPDQGTPLLIVRVPFSAVYGATDTSIVEAAIRNERGTSTLTEDGLRSSTPSLFDGNDEEGLALEGSYTVSFGLGDLSTIDCISTAWTLTTGDGALQIDAVEPELDPSLR